MGGDALKKKTTTALSMTGVPNTPFHFTPGSHSHRNVELLLPCRRVSPALIPCTVTPMTQWLCSSCSLPHTAPSPVESTLEYRRYYARAQCPDHPESEPPLHAMCHSPANPLLPKWTLRWHSGLLQQVLERGFRGKRSPA